MDRSKSDLPISPALRRVAATERSKEIYPIQVWRARAPSPPPPLAFSRSPLESLLAGLLLLFLILDDFRPIIHPRISSLSRFTGCASTPTPLGAPPLLRTGLLWLFANYRERRMSTGLPIPYGWISLSFLMIFDSNGRKRRPIGGCSSRWVMSNRAKYVC